jgi:phage-related protein
MQYFGVNMPAQFTEFGGNLISGLVNGITSGLGTVKDAISSVADNTVGWFKEKLGIHSPSRVFGELGGFITQGAAIGMQGEQARIAKAAVGLATVAATSFAGAQDTGAAPFGGAGVPVDTRPALAAPTAAGKSAAPASAAGGNTYIFQISGSDPKAIAERVRIEIDKLEQRKQSRNTSRLSD